jgi:hypothetical protein
MWRLPPFAGFSLPVEPFGNGEVGETLLMLWAASAPQAFFPDNELTRARTNFDVHLSRYALPALREWNKQGPASLMARGSDQSALRYLCGLVIATERVYGAPVLREALEPLKKEAAHWRNLGIEYSRRNSRASKVQPLRTSALLENVNAVLGQTLAKRGTLPLWLPGALQSSHTFSAQELASRAPLRLKAGESATGWVYVPSGARALRMFVPEGAVKLRIDGTWNAQRMAREVVLDVTKRSGWQKIVLRATGPGSIEWRAV